MNMRGLSEIAMMDEAAILQKSLGYFSSFGEVSKKEKDFILTSKPKQPRANLLGQ